MRRTLFASILVALALFPSSALAQDEVPEKDAFIFISKEGESQSFEFGKYQRLTFGNDSFCLTATDPSLESVTIPYDVFKIVQFGNYEDSSSDIENFPEASDITLLYDKDSNSVIVESVNGSSFLISIFSIDGMLLAQGYGNVDVTALTSGIYVAIATDCKIRNVIKFHK